MTLSCAASVGASAAEPATEAPAPVAASSRTGGLAGSDAAKAAAAVNPNGTPPVPAEIPDVPARVRASVGRYVLSSSTWTTGTAAPRISVRLNAAKRTVARVQVRVEDRSTSRVVTRQSLGVVRSGVDVSTAVTSRLAKRPGAYRLRLIVRDVTGHEDRARARTLRVTAPAPAKAATAPAAAPTAAAPGQYVFPVQGACNFRSLQAQRFHAGRDGGRQHNGQDIGTFDGYPPVVAVTAATVDQVFYDAAGGGWTVVFNGDDGTAYGYLHLKPGSILVQPGTRVVAGQQVANAGKSGGDYDPHLHFEMRPIPWGQNRDKAVDPLPLLERLPNTCTG
ncbi:M23 family metallopeptidase [Patulibacter sp. SYSU D01012]|uniref:murein hydrolase activator EnvC family protein n=1 Tax=Patulibacter sp. SYSU D01012 TaxID=2817381 RepID=UPI001B30F4C2